jgi:hypothetical protein
MGKKKEVWFSFHGFHLAREKPLGLRNGILVHLAIHGLAVSPADDDPRILQLLEMMGDRRAGDFQLIARARERLQDSVAARVQPIPFPQELKKLEALLAGKGFEYFHGLR